MQRTLISLCTLVCALAGWLLGSNRHTPEQEANPTPILSTPQTVDKAFANEEPKRVDVPALLARVVSEFGEQHQRDELSARLFAELQDLQNEDFSGAVAALLSSNDRRSGNAAELLVGYWAERDLPAARQWVLGLRTKASNLAGAVFDTWARSDFPDVCDWLEAHSGELPSKSHREAAGFSLAKAAARADPERGLRLLSIVEPGGAGHSWKLYREWVERKPLAAANRALREPDEKVRRKAIGAIAYAWGPRDPDAARRWAVGIPDPIVSRDTVVSIGSALGSNDPRAGADYLAQIPQSNEARKALSQTVSNWAERDLDSAFGWAADLADVHLGDWLAGEVRNSAISLMTEMGQAKMEQRWRELRAAKQPNNIPAR